MNQPLATKPATSADETIKQNNARVYLLPKRGLPKYLAGLVLQVVLIGVIALALALVIFFVFPEGEIGAYVGLLAVIALVFMPIGTPFLLWTQKKLWQQVKVEIGNGYVTVRHEGAPLEVRILPQQEVRVESEQVTAIREEPYGLVISTQYDSESLVIPIQLDNADYQEIAATLSTWRSIHPRPPGGIGSVISRVRARILDSVRYSQPTLPYYERANSAFGAAIMTACIIIVLLTVVIVLQVRDLQLSQSQKVAILSIYLVTMFGALFGFPVVFAWLDYGLAHIGVNKPVRSGAWMGIVSATIISAFAVVARLSMFISLLVVSLGALVVAGLAWFLSMFVGDPGHAAESYTTAGPDSISCAEEAASRFPIQGSYRLTSDEIFLALGHFYIVQPRSFRSLESDEDIVWDTSIPFSTSQSPSSVSKASRRLSKRVSAGCSSLFQMRPIPVRALRLRLYSILLPQSINRKTVRQLASNHPLRNRELHFFADADAMIWRITGLGENTTKWERVVKVTRTSRGFLIYQDRWAFDWIPFHAFSRGGPKVFAKLAQRLVEYSEVA